MKAKVRETKKDINIDIQIENNLMSKNKYNTPPREDNKFKKKPNEGGGGGGGYDPSLPAEVNAYYGLMAAKNLYETSAKPTRPDLSAALALPAPAAVAALPAPAPMGLLTAPPVPGTPAPGAHGAPPGTPAPGAPPGTPMPSGMGGASSFGFPSMTGMGTMLGASTTMPGTPGMSGIPHADDTNDPLLDPDFDFTDTNLSLIDTVKASIPDLGPVDVQFGLEIFDDVQDAKYNNILGSADDDNMKKRNLYIRKIERFPMYRPRYSTIKKFFLGKHVKNNLYGVWNEIRNGTYPGMPASAGTGT